MASDEALIDEVRKYPLLYDLELDDYKNKKKKDHAWKKVAIKINLNEMQCKKRWKGLRDCYNRCKRRETISSESGATSTKCKWRFMKRLSFLDTVVSTRSIVGNIPTDEKELFEQVITPDLFNDSTQFDEKGSESKTPTSSGVRKQMASDEALIEEVRRHPLLYDLDLEDYKNKKKKNHAWKKIAAKIELDEVQCKKRWRGLRDCYSRCKRRQSESGATSPRRKWRFMKNLSFLDNFLSARSTVENIPTDEKELFEQVITPDLFNESNQFEQKGSESSETPMCSPVGKQNDRVKLEEFLELASESITKTCDAFVQQKPENSTTLLFKSLASKIIETDMPLMESNKLESKVSALVFSEIDKYNESLQWL